MRALQHIAFGNPAEAVRLVTLPDPTPKPNEVVIRMEAAAVHLADIKKFMGEPGFRNVTFPNTPGYEGIGRITAVGSDVHGFKVGDRVFPWWGASTFAELVCTSAEKVMPAPEGDAVQLSLMLVNGMTSVVLLEDYVPLKPGDWVLQNGANSSCGRYAIVLAKEKGVKTCNIVRRPELIAELTALGADAVVLDSENADELAARVSAATDNAEIKLGLDLVAGPATGRIAHCLANGGTVVNYGFISGKPSEIHFNELFWKDIKLVGMSTSRGLAKRSMDELRNIYAKLAGMIATGEMRAAIAGTYTLDQYADAFRHALRTGAERDGKVILLPNG
ncbi:MAG: zinc-dependent alcohol dehydrogenase family protein [Rhodospirillaceae bacterium]|nr:zinc-dependent alcohol dehydrogenase family protein [Rhodospirillaceae bacterium]